MICDGCNKEHHIYCVSPPTKNIPDGAWFCPECQKKGKEMSRMQCEDCNHTVGENVFSSQAFAAIQTLQEMAQKQAVDAKQTASLLASLSVSDLLQVQSCGVRMEWLIA